MLQVSPGNEAHIAAFSTELRLPGGETREFYLHTSPEFACKKLLAAGERRIFSLGKVFRNGEIGSLHQPEFTMLEWYRCGEEYSALIDDCCALANLACGAAGTTVLQWRGQTCDPQLRARRLTVSEAFMTLAGIDLDATLGEDGPRRDALAAQASSAGMRITVDDSWSDIFSKVVSARIEPQLGIAELAILDRYPASEAALARLCAADRRYSERFEFYACGVELANAFGELTDAKEQRRRLEFEMAERKRIYGDPYPLDEDFLRALEIMPDACGIALGADRLIALATGAPSIAHVMWAPMATADGEVRRP